MAYLFYTHYINITKTGRYSVKNRVFYLLFRVIFSIICKLFTVYYIFCSKIGLFKRFLEHTHSEHTHAEGNVDIMCVK